MIDFSGVKESYFAQKNELDSKIAQILSSGNFIMGREVELLESDLANYVGVKNCITVANGSDALYLSLLSLELKEGDEIITTPFSFFASASCIARAGCKIVFCDIDRETFQMDLAKIESLITQKTRAVLAVSIFGAMGDMTRLRKICRAYNLILIEDGAQSFGARDEYNNLSCSIADISTTSFFPTKPLGCFGDGGAIFTQDDELALKIRALRTHGALKKYDHKILGINSRLDALQAGILRVKLLKLEHFLESRRYFAKCYQKLGFKTQAINGKSAFAQFCILTTRRDELVEFLKLNHIPCAIHYPKPLNSTQALKDFHDSREIINAEAICKQILSLPMHPFLESSIEYIAQILCEFEEL